jgi:hypothetical protein
MSRLSCSFSSLVRAAAVTLLVSSAAHAQQRLVTATVTNRARANSVSFAPIHVGFHSGVFSPFSNGGGANAAIISVAEGGGGEQWQSAFAMTDPTAVRGTIGAGGPILIGATRTLSFMVNVGQNPFFTFAGMVIPSNDLFIGNASPIRLFDASGNLMLNRITQRGRDVWDANSEVADFRNAAFVMGGNNDLRTPENGLIAFDASELGEFNGRTTGAGYVFDSRLGADEEILTIDFASSTVVPEPSTVVLLSAGLMALGFAARRRRIAE